MAFKSYRETHSRHPVIYQSAPENCGIQSFSPLGKYILPTESSRPDNCPRRRPELGMSTGAEGVTPCARTGPPTSGSGLTLGGRITTCTTALRQQGQQVIYWRALKANQSRCPRSSQGRDFVILGTTPGRTLNLTPALLFTETVSPSPRIRSAINAAPLAAAMVHAEL